MTKTDQLPMTEDEKLIAKLYNRETGVYTLQAAAKCKGRTLTEVTLHRFKGKHMDEFRQVKDDYERTKAMIIQSAQIAPEDYDEFDAQDLRLISDIIADFL